MNYQWGKEWRCRNCGKDQGSPLNTCIDCHWEGLQMKEESDAARAVRALENECQTWKNQALATREELAAAKKDIRELENNRKELFDSINRLEGQVRGYKTKVAELSGITIDQLRAQIVGLMTKQVDGIVEELKKRLVGP